MASKATQSTAAEFPFYQYLRLFYDANEAAIRRHYSRLSLKFLDHNDPDDARTFLRRPQYEALEIYIFLKEFGNNRHLWELFDDWYHEKNGFEGRGRTSIGTKGQMGLFEELTADSYKDAFKTLRSFGQLYPNYIYALTMGLGKTVLMATSIFYEFLLANKYPQDPRFCHNALVFAPDKTVLQSLKEIQTFDKSKVVPPEYVNWLNTHLQFHFLDDTGLSLNVIDRSKYNIIISNTQKVILKKQHKDKTAGEQLFAAEGEAYKAKSTTDGYGDLYNFGAEVEDEADLLQNQRFAKLTRLEQLGIYVDEAHHAFGTKLAADMGLNVTKTSLRLTINELAARLKEAGTRVVACFNYTGTPYIGNRLLPEVVYTYGLKDAIDNRYLKKVTIDAYENIKEKEFIRTVVKDFWKKHKGKKYEGMRPKIAFFASTIEELTQKVRPALEEVLSDLNIPTSKILVNVGDEKITTNDDLREFIYLDTADSKKQFILLVGKGKEGWNCRSLFGVALHRKPDSRIFVLQATMRCLRSITGEQQTGSVYLSKDNLDILNDELEKNFRLSVQAIQDSGEKGKPVEVRVVPPPVKITLKRISKLQKLEEKPIRNGIDLELEKVDTDRYRIIHQAYSGLDLTKTPYKEDVSYIREQREFSEITVVAEIARYLNKPPLFIRDVLQSTVDGVETILKAVNKFNELLYDHIIPRLFSEFYSLKEYKSEEDYTVELVKAPDAEDGCYRVTAKEDLIADVKAADYREFKAKSFHLDHYCFDSTPEKDFFWKCLHDGSVDKVWFTGMLTHGQSEFSIAYIDPISNTLRHYYPDFLVRKKDGTHLIVEIKGDNKVDDAVVKAKQDFATQLATGSGFTYRMIKGSEAKQGLAAA
ncbi:MAG: type III restriction endonuclease [Methylococcales bacterium]|nr:MAG: type III restriction endonuclease [Methylococcales bacterium]